jgi:hypothetical protein
MVILMFKLASKATFFATIILSGLATMAEAGPAAPFGAASCGTAPGAAHPLQCRMAARGGMLGLIPIRDVRSAGNGNGNGNGCWGACFDDFSECVGIRTKNLCVSRVKICLETCDRLSNRPGM